MGFGLPFRHRTGFRDTRQNRHSVLRKYPVIGHLRFLRASLREGLLLVHNTLVGLNLRHRMRLGCAGKVISAFDVARMIAGHCPTGGPPHRTRDARRPWWCPTKPSVTTAFTKIRWPRRRSWCRRPARRIRARSPRHIVRCTGEQEVKLPVGAARARGRPDRAVLTQQLLANRGARQSQLEAARDLKKLGVADTQHRAGAALPGLNLDTLLIDLHLEDGAALSLVRTLRERQADRPKSCRWPRTPATRCCSPPCARAPMPYLLESDLPIAASLLRRMVAGKASMAAPVALQTCNSSTNRHWRRVRASQKSLRAWG